MNTLAEMLKTLVHIPSPSGFTENISNYLMTVAQKAGINAEKTRKGAVIYKFEGEKTGDTVMFAAHMDTLGAMVSRVMDDRICFSPLGGYPALYIVGNYCTIHTQEHGAVKGTILPGNPADHVNKALKKDYKPEIETLCIRPDVNCMDNSLGDLVSVGDFISFDPQWEENNGFIKSRHLDDKASCAVLLALASEIAEKGLKLRCNVEFFFNVTEETGQGMAGVSKNVGDLVIVDMGVVGEGCNGDEYHVSICAKDTSGPYNHELTRELVQTAKNNAIPFKMDVFPFYSSDGSMVLRSCNDLRVALIGPGVSASHGYERTHEKALEGTFELIKAYIRKE